MTLRRLSGVSQRMPYLMLPRIAAKVPVTRKDITVLGHGGLCLGCAECRYPACSFGKA